MGDSGSLLLGLVNAILVMKFIAVADAPGAILPITSAVAVGFAILLLPLLDTLRVFTIRIFGGRSPFSPDRNHIHHLLLDRGMDHKSVTLCCLLLNMAFITVAYFSRGLGATYLLFTITGLAFTMLGILLYVKKPVPKTLVAPSFQQNQEVFSHPLTKVVSINTDAVMNEN